MTRRYDALAILDDDTVIARDFVERSAEHLKPGVAIVVGQTLTRWEDDRRWNVLLGSRAYGYWRFQTAVRRGQSALNVVNCVAGSNSVYRSSLLDQVLVADTPYIVDDTFWTLDTQRRQLGRIVYAPTAKAWICDPANMRDRVWAGEVARRQSPVQFGVVAPGIGARTVAVPVVVRLVAAIPRGIDDPGRRVLGRPLLGPGPVVPGHQEEFGVAPRPNGVDDALGDPLPGLRGCRPGRRRHLGRFVHQPVAHDCGHVAEAIAQLRPEIGEVAGRDLVGSDGTAYSLIAVEQPVGAVVVHVEDHPEAGGARPAYGVGQSLDLGLVERPAELRLDALPPQGDTHQGDPASGDVVERRPGVVVVVAVIAPGLALENDDVASSGPGVPNSPPAMLTPRRSLACASMTEA